LLSSLGVNSGDLQLGVGLTMPMLAAVVLPTLELEDDDLLGPILRDDLRADLGPLDERLANLGGVAPRDEQNLVEFDRVSGVAGEFLDAKLLTLFDSVLFTARLDDRVHGARFLWRKGDGELVAFR